MSFSLSFHNSVSAGFNSQLLLWPRQPDSVVVQVHSRTRREDRTARHSRIRKKAPISIHSAAKLESDVCLAKCVKESDEEGVEGTPERPRLCVFRSNKHLYAQVIDDTKMHTLASASTMQKPISEEIDYSAGPTIDVARRVGELLGKSCIEKGITKVAFDRGGYPYHGRIQALADAAREQGLEF